MDQRSEPTGGDSSSLGSIPERMGDFRLIERLGAGGMGVVYLARQESLQRDVALKLILPEHLHFDEARERFRREVEAVAKLNHPGVVPVYSVGEERGLPYFTMELVEGCSLGAVIEELCDRSPESLDGADMQAAIAKHSRRFHDASSGTDGAFAFSGTWVQACCRLMVQVAEALQHAHDRGVVHRDVKPSNIVVTAKGRAMLLDFGLASDEHASRITRTGSNVGSLPYMPPERVRSGLGGADARGDVYSFGVSFYELLSLHLPFDQRAIAELYEAIAAGEFKALRTRNPAIPWDAATVCSTAMERDLGRRYATSGALARDLHNLLELRPIAAEPPSSRLRAKRWIQRHPTRSVAAALGFLLLVVAPSVAWWRIAKARDAALAELSARESMLDFLMQMINAADPEGNNPMGGQTLQDVVDNGTQRIRGQLLDFPKVRAELLLSLSKMQQKLGRPKEALAMSEEALELTRSIFGIDSLEAVEAERALAVDLVSLGENERALSLFEHARRLIAESAPAPETQLWDIERDIAAVLVQQQRFEEAQALLERMGDPANSPAKTDLKARSTWLSALAEANKGLGRFELAENGLKEAVDVSTQVWGRQHISVARALQNLGALHVDRGQLDLALTELEEAQAIRSALSAKESIEDARLAHNLSAVYNKLGQHENALAQSERSLALTRRFAGDSMQSARASAGVGAMLCKLERFDEAEPILREALALSRRFIARTGVPAAEAPLWLARCRARQGSPEEALLFFTEVLECVRDDPACPVTLLIKVEGECADVLTSLGRLDEADQHRERAKAHAGGG